MEERLDNGKWFSVVKDSSACDDVLRLLETTSHDREQYKLSTPVQQRQFVQHIHECVPLGDPHFCWVDVERELKSWIVTNAEAVDTVLAANERKFGEAAKGETDRRVVLLSRTHQRFTVVAKSTNLGGFGHRQYIMCAQDGSAWKVQRIYLYSWEIGQVVNVPLVNGEPDWCGIPHRGAEVVVGGHEALDFGAWDTGTEVEEPPFAAVPPPPRRKKRRRKSLADYFYELSGRSSSRTQMAIIPPAVPMLPPPVVPVPPTSLPPTVVPPQPRTFADICRDIAQLESK